MKVTTLTDRLTILAMSFIVYFWANIVYTNFIPHQTGTVAGITTIYYVSPTGSDTNPGTATAPFKSFTKATSVLTPGSELRLYGGTYLTQLKVTQNGTPDAYITITAVTGQKPVIDISNSATTGIQLSGSYINISDIEVKNVKAMGVRLDGNFINASRLNVHHVYDQGVQVQGSHVAVKDSTIYLTSLMNQSKSISGGWPSALKVRTGEYVLFEGNTIYNNYGEGIGLRGKHLVVRGNTVFDNYSVNIYIDNSYDVWVEKNYAYCTGNTQFYRNNGCATNIAMAEEYYTGWGWNLGQVTIVNNILTGGWHNLNYFISSTGSTNPGVFGVKGAVIANNTLWGSQERAVRFDDQIFNENIYFYNNIVQQKDGKLADFKSTRGITRDYNFWVGTPTLLINATGIHDLRGDIGLPSTPDVLNPQSFRLSSSSRAINVALKLNQTSFDFAGNTRDELPDRGAYEYFLNTPSPIDPTPTQVGITFTPPTPTSTGTTFPPTPTSIGRTLPPPTPTGTGITLPPPTPTTTGITLPPPTPIIVITDTTPPIVGLSSISDTTSLTRGSSIYLTATASDNVGVTKVIFFIDGKAQCTATSSPYLCKWRVPSKPNQSYVIYAKAYDAAGNSTQSSTVTISAK